MKKKRPQVTVVSTSSEGLHVSEIVRALDRRGITHSVIDFDSSKTLAHEMKKLGSITLWRASSLGVGTQRSSVVNYIDRTYMVNEAVFLRPAVTEKYYQQQTLAASASLAKYAIPTFIAKNKLSLQRIIQRGDLAFPVIAKPNNGSRGEGIHKLEEIDDVEKLERPLKDYVLQNFICNSGDWRVIVLGGRPLEAMKRVAQKGSYLNNVSRGAHAFCETDEVTRKELFSIAPKVAALFRLRFCGVDIIHNDKTGELKILEVNTAPQWAGEFGFRSVTGVDVGDKFADYAEHILGLDSTVTSLDVKIDAYYKQNSTVYTTERFHYASRVWLWKKDEWARSVLDDMRDWYIGKSPKATKAVLAGIVAKSDAPLSVNQKKEHRRVYFEKYRLLPVYNALLFRVMFSESLYDYDIRPYVRELVDDTDFLKLFTELGMDRDAVRVLSTHAVNFFYLLKNYFKSLRLSSSVLVDPYELIELAEDYDDLVERKILRKKDAVKLQIYLLTHAILGESKFYQTAVKTSGFLEMCKMLEAIIQSHYFDVSLDNKFEFLVCADICRYDTKLRNLILAEAQKSVSWAGVFLVDTHANAVRHVLSTSEHRNVLYIMASHIRYIDTKTVKTTPSLNTHAHKSNHKKTIGRLARVRLQQLSNFRFIARVDTGATWSSLCVSDVHEADGTLHYKFLYPGHPLYTGASFSTKEYSQKRLSSAGRKDDVRYTVRLSITVGNDPPVEVECTLADRQHLLYPVLLGRDILKGRYKVDTEKQFALSSGKKESRTA